MKLNIEINLDTLDTYGYDFVGEIIEREISEQVKLSIRSALKKDKRFLAFIEEEKERLIANDLVAIAEVTVEKEIRNRVLARVTDFFKDDKVAVNKIKSIANKIIKELLLGE